MSEDVAGSKSTVAPVARANYGTSADGGWRVLFAFVPQWTAAAEFSRSAAGSVSLTRFTGRN